MAGLSEGQLQVLAGSGKDQLEGLFRDHPLWEFEKILGNGSFGIAVLLRDRGARKFGQYRAKVRKPKRVVLKRPVYPGGGFRDFDNELVGLRKTNGLMHHVQAIATTESVSQHRKKSREGFRDWIRNLFAPFYNPPTNVFSILSRYEGPAILMEYIENGDLLTFVRKSQERRIVLPNRLLWRFYFCLIRGICGIIYQQKIPAKGQLTLEAIPDGGQPGTFIHGDLASRNIMIGESDPEVEDHRVTPILKYIDYGMSGSMKEAGPAVRFNLFQVAETMLWMISDERPPVEAEGEQITQWKGIYTFAVNIIPFPSGYDPCPHLDEELRDLIAETLRVTSASRPTPREIFMRIENGMKKTPEDYPPHRQYEESDEQIKARLQSLLHDA
ncbi:hypothetical protein F4803DRAFT_557454 [Xylaria telfairii]|nr:hypothetical protein F4803DRAFT_557454 [Xylaria telfairii]